jgi:peroxiredoxin Q/BCP
LRAAFGVPKTLGLFPGRVTYVIDKQGLVRMAFSAQLVADQHVEKALQTVRELA